MFTVIGNKVAAAARSAATRAAGSAVAPRGRISGCSVVGRIASSSAPAFSSSSSKPASDAAAKVVPAAATDEEERVVAEVPAASFQGRYVFEGQVLPVASDASDSTEVIESRLARRLQRKDSSAKLSATIGVSSSGESMEMWSEASDRAAADVTAQYQVTDSKAHLDDFQTKLRRLRQTGRGGEGRDVSDSGKLAMEYLARKKVKAGKS
eukprot:TRINITY_DN7439_c0_g1_i1.p1 TRINITY_DN7439_c0_g1~~TRINITY_DN7439_c0_g1_i1.p1  ORF type:complete len:209 (-),score=39.64 TRINITY_DN7439_c0_g1_i1:23-649(-)